MELSIKEIKELPMVKGILLVFIIITLFVLPVFSTSYTKILYTFFFTGTFVFAALSLRQHRKILLGCSIILSLSMWVVTFSQWESYRSGLRILQFVFLLSLVAGFTKQIASNSKVTGSIFLDAITGYLLLGFAFSIVVTVLSNLDPGAYNTGGASTNIQRMYETLGEYIFYTFMTYTTAGYGNIEPIHPVAKSLAILISVTGQLYIATIISLLIGKYASSKSQS